MTALSVFEIVWLSVCTKMSTLSETSLFIISTCYIRVRNSLYIPHERERTLGSLKKQTFHFIFAFLKLPAELYLEQLLSMHK